MTVMAHKLMMDWSNKEDIKRGMTVKWQDNAVKNIAYFDNHPEKMAGSVHKMPTYEGKAVIYVGRGKSLEKAIDMFDAIDDRFIIVCTNSSLRYLLDHAVIPDYMICIDGEKGEWTFDHLPEGADKVTAIFAAGAYHEEVVKWPGKIMVTPYGVKKGSVQKEIRKRWGKSIPAGGNALNGALAIFLTFTLCKIHVFVGNNLSFKEGDSFYFDKETERDDKAYFIMHDIYGEECLTDMPMYQYKIWLEQTANSFFPDCVFFNCSEGLIGVDVDNSLMPIFQYMPLENAITMIKDALDFEKRDTITRCRDFYQILYDETNYFPTNGTSVWESIMSQIKKEREYDFKNALDVGCGTGAGIALARKEGYNVHGADIVNNIRLWEQNGVADVCVQAPAHDMPFKDDEFDFIYCGDVMEHIPEEYIIPTLKEMYRVCSNRFVFVIATTMDWNNKSATVPVHTHISLKSPEQWREIIISIGYKIIAFSVVDEHVVFQLSKEDICQSK